MKAYHMSKSTLWETPAEIFEPLNEAFGFTLDVCALPNNAKCKRFFTPENDGLEQDWQGERCWMNPPYGRGVIEKWIRKARYEAARGALVVALLPAATSTRWFQDYCAGRIMQFIPGRVKFVGAKSHAPFSSVLVIFHPEVTARKEATE